MTTTMTSKPPTTPDTSRMTAKNVGGGDGDDDEDELPAAATDDGIRPTCDHRHYSGSQLQKYNNIILKSTKIFSRALFKIECELLIFFNFEVINKRVNLLRLIPNDVKNVSYYFFLIKNYNAYKFKL